MMRVQHIYVIASEEFEENGCYNLKDGEFDFLKERLSSLNSKQQLDSKDSDEAVGIFVILLYAEKEDFIRSFQLNEQLNNIFQNIFDEFCGK